MVIFRDQSLFEYNEGGTIRNQQISRGKFIFSSIILAVVIVALSTTFMRNFYYIDIASACVIKTEYSVHTKDKVHLHQAIKTIRATMPSTYGTLCNYVKTIRETNCIIANENGPLITYTDSVGCYIKGTKTVFMQPLTTLKQKPTNEEIANSLARYSKYSEEFWLSN